MRLGEPVLVLLGSSGLLPSVPFWSTLEEVRARVVRVAVEVEGVVEVEAKVAASGSNAERTEEEPEEDDEDL
jgi:hypothetical protein